MSLRSKTSQEAKDLLHMSEIVGKPNFIPNMETVLFSASLEVSLCSLRHCMHPNYLLFLNCYQLLAQGLVMNSELGESVSRPLHDAVAGLCSIFLAFVLVEQSLTLKFLLRKENRRKRLTPYLINLAVTNLVFVCSCYPLSIASNLSRRFVSGKPVCILLGYIASAAVLVTFASFTACTCLVYNATKELTRPLTMKRNKDIKIILLIWVLAFGVLSPLIEFWNQESFQPGTSGCTPMRLLKTPEDIAYFVVLTIVAFCAPMTISAVYSVKIFLFFVQAKPFQMSLVQQRKYREFKNVSKMIIALVLVYVVCWIPYSIVSVVTLVGHPPSPDLQALLSLLSKSSVLYTPIIYATFNSKFRVAMVSLLQCDSCRKAQIGVSHPNQNELHRALNLQKMTPRSPLVFIARNAHGVVLHQELAVSSDSLFNVPRYREKLIAVSSGLKVYSLEED